tara:strand:+ start:250 stop:555 length:306 start_codon:yes stop_codon:yes gene_type:complete
MAEIDHTIIQALSERRISVTFVFNASRGSFVANAIDSATGEALGSEGGASKAQALVNLDKSLTKTVTKKVAKKKTTKKVGGGGNVDEHGNIKPVSTLKITD